MKTLTLLFTICLATIPAIAQIELVADNYFPAEFEFEELQSIASENRITDPGGLVDIENGKLIADVGFDSYKQRIYNVKNSRTLSIEVLSLLDTRAAYSLLTLLRTSDIQEGPPGDAFVSAPGRLLFCHGRRWVRILGHGISDALIRRVAGSVSNRIGPPEKKLPSLISLFPEHGLDISTIQYFPGSKPFESFGKETSESIIQVLSDMEIARARFFIKNQSGTLSLLKFPTHQIAEEYFSELSRTAPSYEKEARSYFRRIGPLLCVLEGSFSPDTANVILNPIQYSYTVQWIYDKNSKPATVWGIPVSILGSTVLAFFIVVLTCSFSILAGIGLAACRLLMRQFFPKNPLDNPKRTDITRLKLP
ncbi:MAG: hypothetical protein JXR49_01890 [Acidobacteria bacterium]|nr:hypothetical protein [Acidobacteriota bacterium]